MESNSVGEARPLIVYVEDDADTFKLAAVRLRQKYQLVWAKTDEEACKILRDLGDRLYAVLVDIELAGSKLDGLALVRLLRGTFTGPLPTWAQGVPVLTRTPVIVLTAYAGRYSETDTHAVGANHFIVKPIDFTRLNLALAQANIQSVMERLSRPADDARAPASDRSA